MIFLNKNEIIRIHQKLIDKFGGIEGLLDEGALVSALSAVENRVHYENIDIYQCAATYAYHITKAHAFIDGNKRIAAAASEIFLEINGFSFNAQDGEIYDLFMGIASSEKSRDEIETFFQNVK